MITLTLPWLPPTFNHAYMPIRIGRFTKMALTSEGRTFLKESTAHLSANYPAEIAQIKKNTPYFVLVALYFKAIENKGWPKTTSSRYKTLDVTNRLKILEDAVVGATDVDDSSNMFFGGIKLQRPVEGTTLRIFDATVPHPLIDAVYDAV